MLLSLGPCLLRLLQPSLSDFEAKMLRKHHVSSERISRVHPLKPMMWRNHDPRSAGEGVALATPAWAGFAEGGVERGS